ncbi:dihydroxyacetone kinase subunit DhaK [Suicoccus acidiformans]|uniref:phosphoenolpyruvate--glycerone phosphotransferase n=1 Tax=Suicoccus acidiformans TaxID=2036206 RepID=A0A347WIF8_9LACT|nr:dihydroxyacetone kinase subunit DhaK [Suicoccus acidiformans]AXY24865.1 dihydroxyacetone kinase subunit DhaK [Suicoccus acidiformans]
MKKIINTTDQILDQMVDGIALANQEIVERLPETNVIKQKDISQQVALVSGGGSGHEPAHAGFVGDGMLQAAVCGQVFTSPTSDQVYEAIKAVDQGEGVLLIIKNYSGDIMNFEMAMDLAEMDDIQVGKVIVDDDISVEDSEFTQGKRGVAGTILVHKILGAAARSGKTLDELVTLGEQLVQDVKTIGVALSGATVPEVGKPGFVLEEDELEFGVGIHGEAGYRREKMQSSHDIALEMLEKLKQAFDWQAGDQYGILVNGMGATPLMEQYIFYNDVHQKLSEEGLDLAFSKVGNYMTSLDMAGLSLTLIKLNEDYLAYLNEAVDTAAW